MNLLIIGGAGYIGSHMVKRLLIAKHALTILDNLSTGYRDAVLGGNFYTAMLEIRHCWIRCFPNINSML